MPDTGQSTEIISTKSQSLRSAWAYRTRDKDDSQKCHRIADKSSQNL